MSSSKSRSASGPVPPFAMWWVCPWYSSAPTGEMTAAVPAPNTSSRVPFSCARRTSSMVRRSSATGMSQLPRSFSTESLVIPARIVSPAGGVITVPSILNRMFIEPTSSM